MKTLLALIVLINLLGYLMMTNVPPLSERVDTGSGNDRSGSAQVGSLTLLSELSDERRAALVPAPLLSAPALTVTLCDVLGPFADERLAVAELATLVADLPSLKGLVLASPSAEFWLSIPASETLDISSDSRRQIQTKKRYREDCMEVANRLKFH